jgi:Tol biopolymer transport system component
MTHAASGQNAFSVSDTGVLVYASGATGLNQPTWFSRSGEVEGTVGPVGSYLTMALSPDGRRVVHGRREPGSTNISLMITELGTGHARRLTFHRDLDGTWPPDMSRIVFGSTRQGVASLFEVPVTGGVERVLLRRPAGPIVPDDWAPDGGVILYHVGGDNRLWACRFPATASRSSLSRRRPQASSRRRSPRTADGSPATAASRAGRRPDPRRGPP